MADEGERAISDVLDRLEAAAGDGSVSVQDILDRLGRKSFAAAILVPALLAVSPASGIPGLTTAVGLTVAVVVAQMLAGRDCVWMPGFIARRRIPSDRLRQAVAWLRRPVAFVERFLRPRLGVLVSWPGLYLPLGAILAIALFMPALELIPTSGSIAAAAIAIFASGLLTRDGLLVLLALAVIGGLPFAAWRLAA